MKYQGNLFIISMAVFGAYFARGAIAAQNAPTAFSTYGLIQPVNKYSSNPFWNTDSPYNQRMPVPVYATGADLNTGDCNRVVETLVATYCASHNYCTDSRINDIRPTVMVQLSQLPGHNFATSCGGYIDSVFENYQKTYGNMSAGTLHYTTAPTVQQTNTAQYKNPLQQKPNAYQTGVAERTAELERLQRATSASPELGPTDFPKTTADLSFTDRLANTTAGYEPYKDLNPYKTPQFESDEEFYERLKKLNPTEYCKRFPNDKTTCKDNTKQETNSAPPPTSTSQNTGSYTYVDPGVTPTIEPVIEPIAEPVDMPQCIHNIENDSKFQQYMTMGLASVRDFDTWLQNNKATFYDAIGGQIVQHCLNANTLLLREFNSFLDRATVINIVIPGHSSVSMPISDVFDYVNFPTAILVSHIRNGVPGNDIKKGDIRTDYFFNDSCADHSVRFGTDSNTAVNKAGKAAAYSVPTSGGYTFFLDMPNTTTRVFPGLLLASNNGFGGAENVVIMTNYLAAHEKIKAFSEALNNTACSDDRLATYIVKLPVNISRQQSNNTPWYLWLSPAIAFIEAAGWPEFFTDVGSVKIIDGPYIIK